MNSPRFFVVLATAMVLLSSNSTAQNTENPPLEDAFDFMVGEWETVGQVNRPDAPESLGTMLVYPLFSETGSRGFTVETRQLPLADPGDSAFGLVQFESSEMFVLHGETQTWRGIGHNSLGNRKWIEVSIVDGNLVWIKTGELFGDVDGQTRFVYLDVTENSFSVRVDYSADGETWYENTYFMTAERINLSD
ncbi:MAG: hypothetical protein DHS20C06_21270 [Hyphobacterium sp.]|nr:MAG: hypothetical protein DHS20C06_21270 [Hyphobacterium sp.]